MQILFSPSEKKNYFHKLEIKPNKEFYKNFLSDGLEDVLNKYDWFLKNANDEEIKKMLGVKQISLEEIRLLQNIFSTPLLKAVLRYNGVAFRALNYENLNLETQEYIDKRVFIFSNLFGILRADSCIPYYDLKQNCGFLDFETKKFYLHNKNCYLNFFESVKEVLDLRAVFYQKCFMLPRNILVYEPVFIKNQKKISHYAKYYRGILLRECANNSLESLRHLEDLLIQGLRLLKIEKTDCKVILYYEVQE